MDGSNLGDQVVQRMREYIDGYVKLHAPTDLYPEFHAWLASLPREALRAYTHEVGRFETHASIQIHEASGISANPTIRMKAEQSAAFYALALWRKYELRPLTRM